LDVSRLLPWRPTHGSSTKDVEMKMGHRIARIWTRIDHGPIATVRQAFDARDLTRCANHGADDRIVLWLERLGVRNVLVGHDQDVDRHLRIDVAERGHLVVLEHDAGRDLPAD